MGAFAPATNDERELLLAYLDLQRNGLRNAAYGLTDDQARQTPTVSSLSVGGLIKHVAMTEHFWIDNVVLQHPFPAMEGGPEAYQHGFRLGDGETLAGALARYAEVQAFTEAAIRDVPELTWPVPVPRGAPWFPKDVEAWDVRWVLVHLIEETARHAGHADIIREAVDGATMYPLMAAAEGWPETEWLKPWRPGSN